jgi:hypothetical protein
MNPEQRANWSYRLAKTTKRAEAAAIGAVSGGIIYGGIRIGPGVVSEINSWLHDNPWVCVGSIAAIVVLTIASGERHSSKSDSPPKKYDMTPFSGGHVSEDINVASEIDEPPVH